MNDTSVLAAAEAKVEWKDAFDEGEVVGMRTITTDAENPYPEGSNPYAGWSFGFWGSRNRAIKRALEARLEMMISALLAHRHDLHEYSRRACPTCRRSADALGILNLVPDSCARKESDLAILAAAQEHPPE
jgi:hypothetical protein